LIACGDMIPSALARRMIPLSQNASSNSGKMVSAINFIAGKPQLAQIKPSGSTTFMRPAGMSTAITTEAMAGSRISSTG
jgi:hypothetical protein